MRLLLDSGNRRSRNSSADFSFSSRQYSGTADGFYNIGVSATNASESAYTASASATPVPISISVSTDQASYSSNQTVTLTVTVLSGTPPDSGAIRRAR